VGYTVYNIKIREVIMENNDKKLAAAALMLVAGGIIGAGLALLYAPQSGQRTRRDICRSAKRVKSRADETVEDLKDTISDLVESIGVKTEDLVEKGKDVAGSARKDLMRLIEEGASKLERFRTRLSRM
jgi:gas vesicle protein